jgi:hypothetical protein
MEWMARQIEQTPSLLNYHPEIGIQFIMLQQFL